MAPCWSRAAQEGAVAELRDLVVKQAEAVAAIGAKLDTLAAAQEFADKAAVTSAAELRGLVGKLTEAAAAVSTKLYMTSAAELQRIDGLVGELVKAAAADRAELKAAKEGAAKAVATSAAELQRLGGLVGALEKAAAANCAELEAAKKGAAKAAETSGAELQRLDGIVGKLALVAVAGGVGGGPLDRPREAQDAAMALLKTQTLQWALAHPDVSLCTFKFTRDGDNTIRDSSELVREVTSPAVLGRGAILPYSHKLVSGGGGLVKTVDEALSNLLHSLTGIKPYISLSEGRNDYFILLS